MGIGNTTAASAIAAVLTGAPPDAVTGRGTGVDDAGRAAQGRGHRAGDRGERARPRPTRSACSPRSAVSRSPLLVGVIVGGRRGARSRSCSTGSSPAPRRSSPRGSQPAVAPRLIAAHRSVEPGHAIVLERARPPAAARPRPAARGGERCGARDGPARRRRPGPRRDGDLRVRGRRRSGRRPPS